MIDAAAWTPDGAGVAALRIDDASRHVRGKIKRLADELIKVGDVKHQRVAMRERGGRIHRRAQLRTQRVLHVRGAEDRLERDQRIAGGVDAAMGVLQRLRAEIDPPVIDIDHRRRQQGMFGPRNGPNRQRLHANFQRQHRVKADRRLRQSCAEIDANPSAGGPIAFAGIVHL